MDIVAINCEERIALTDSGESLTIDTFLDAMGDDCSPEDARAFIVQMPDGSWATDLTDSYERVTTH